MKNIHILLFKEFKNSFNHHKGTRVHSKKKVMSKLFIGNESIFRAANSLFRTLLHFKVYRSLRMHGKFDTSLLQS